MNNYSHVNATFFIMLAVIIFNSIIFQYRFLDGISVQRQFWQYGKPYLPFANVNRIYSFYVIFIRTKKEIIVIIRKKLWLLLLIKIEIKETSKSIFQQWILVRNLFDFLYIYVTPFDVKNIHSTHIYS